MIDWYVVVVNSFWIAGAAVLLAAFSYHYWIAEQASHRLREQLNQTSFLRSFWLGILLIALGLAGTSSRAWEITVWSVFALLSLVNVVKVVRD